MRLLRTATVVALLACGTSSSQPDASAGADASDDTSLDFDVAQFTGDGTAVIPSNDASVEDGGGWFMCGQCPCDGRTHYCDIGYGPGAPWAGDASDDACAYSTCTPLPDGCAPARCACLIPSAGMCACFLADSGDGLMAGCFYP
jgi:hypothetical protein